MSTAEGLGQGGGSRPFKRGRTMIRAINTFVRNQSGAFAMQFALMAIPLCVCTGLAIDGGRAFLARFELASALDAAALAVGSTLDEDADLDAVARKFVDMNFKTAHDDPISLELIPSADDESLTLKGSVAINTFFMPLVGQPYVTVEAESEVRRGGNSVEVALALDITESMNATRMSGLKAAAKVLINEVVGTSQTPYFSRAAIIPWGNAVHINTNHVTGTALAELRGDIRGTTSISAATWRNSGTTTKTISQIGWRTNTGKSISSATWRDGSTINITNITKSSGKIVVTYSATSSTHYANGSTVVIAGAGGSYTGLNNQAFKVADRSSGSPRTFTLQQIGTTTYVTPPTGNTASTSGTTQRCLFTNCEMRITANGHGFATNDLIYINGSNGSGSGLSTIDNTWGTTYTITTDPADTTNRFTLNGTFGPDYKNSITSGTASECYVSDCRYRITTSASHSFGTSDDLFIWGVSETGSGTSVNTAANSSIRASSPSGSVFFLPGNGNSYKDPTAQSGSVAECLNASCNVQVTSSNHGLSNGERVQISGVTGLTGINTCTTNTTSGSTSFGSCSSGTILSWVVGSVATNTFTLVDSTPALANMANNYSSGGTSQCLSYGCNKQWFMNASSTPAERIFNLSNCLTERYGDDAYTDAATDTAATRLGLHYQGGEALTQCGTGNYVTPLTSNKQRLTDAIDQLVVKGSTAGHIGVAWGWYMLSPNFASVWDSEAMNAPSPYDTPELVKVMILMTDGEFNTAHCSGVTSKSYSYQPSSNLAHHINCNPSDGPFTQAQALCTAMKTQKIVVYTVGLQLGTATDTINFLTNCATSPQHAHLAADNDELKAAFQKIATSISKLRLSK